jgi:hypothetical protein
MFKPLIASRTSPAMTPLFPADVNSTLADILAAVYADTDESFSIIGPMVLIIITTANEEIAVNNGGDEDGDDNGGGNNVDNDNNALIMSCRSLFVEETYKTFLDDERFPKNLTVASTNDDNKKIQRLMIKNAGGAIGWIADLINAAKKKPLTEVNVIGYFASIEFTCKKPSKVMKFINSISPYFSDMISDEGFRANLVQNVWTQYRCTRCSTGKVLYENLSVLRELKIVSEDEVILIEDDNENLWDVAKALKIPKRIVAYCNIYLIAAGREIDNWYQGEKSMAVLSAAKIRSAKLIFKKYLAISSNVNAIEDASNLTQLHEAVPDGFFSS